VEKTKCPLQRATTQTNKPRRYDDVVASCISLLFQFLVRKQHDNKSSNTEDSTGKDRLLRSSKLVVGNTQDFLKPQALMVSASSLARTGHVPKELANPTGGFIN
jgi:hypothetical protein